MVGLRGGDELGIGIHPHHRVTAGGKFGADPAGATAGVEDAGASGEQGVDQPGFTCEVSALRLHLPETLDVALRVSRSIVGNPASGHKAVIAATEAHMAM